jgi:hypothetical protein
MVAPDLRWGGNGNASAQWTIGCWEELNCWGRNRATQGGDMSTAGLSRMVTLGGRWGARQAPTGRKAKAQGNALGPRPTEIRALKGRNSMGRTIHEPVNGAALSGLGRIEDRLPRALPWAVEGRPVGAGNNQPHLPPTHAPCDRPCCPWVARHGLSAVPEWAISSTHERNR